jgi:tetratricopeptide (TPR) repeat protein
LTSIHLDLGALGDAADAAHKALTLSCRAKDLSDEYKSLAWVAWVAHLCGRLDNASTFFSKAKSLWRRIDSANQHLVSVAGIQHATHLLRRNRAEEAHQVTTFNLGVVIKVGYIENICLCHSLLGDLAAFAGRHEEARENYNQAVQIARNKIAVRYVLIAVLAARGRWAARRREPALSDLEEALDYAIVGGYSLYEADIRVGLACGRCSASVERSAADAADEREDGLPLGSSGRSRCIDSDRNSIRTKSGLIRNPAGEPGR